MNDLYLEYPPGFTSPYLYQSSAFHFPHDLIVQYDYQDLVNWFFKKDYIIPYYIQLSNPNFNDSIDDILNILKSNSHFVILGAGFMYLKGLIEKIENINELPNLDVINMALYIIDTTEPANDKIRGLRNNVINYFNIHTKYHFLITLNSILNVVQNIIIHVIRYVSIHYIFPNWFNHLYITSITKHLKLLINTKPKLIMGIPKNYSIYLGTRIPIIEALEEDANRINESHYTIKW